MMTRTALCAALIVACTGGALCADLDTGRLYECAPTAAAPAIDGRLDDPCWQSADVTGQFVRVLKGPEVIQQTSFRVVYDEARLYIGVTCLEANPAGIVAAIRSNDQSAVMADDAVEIFIHPDLSEPTYYQLSANSVGTRYDGRAFDSTWNADWQTAGSVGEDAWYLECAISFESLGRFGAPGAVWGLNICRDRSAGGDTEWSAWADTMGAFHSPERFGRLIFGAAGEGVSRAALIECARFAQKSIALEGRVNAALKLIEGGNLGALTDQERQGLDDTVGAARQSLEAVKALLAGEAVLVVPAWMQATDDLARAAGDLDRLAWSIRFSTLLADD